MLDFLCSSTQLYMLLSPSFGIIYFFISQFVFLVDDASMGWGSLMQTKHIFVLIHYRNNGEVGTLKQFRRTGNFYWLFFCGSFCYLNLISVMLSCLFLVALRSTAGKGLTSWLSLRDIFFVVVTFMCGFLGHMWYLIASIPDFCFLPYLV